MISLKLIQIKINDLGVKTSCIIEENKERKEYDIQTVINLINQGKTIKNAKIQDNELYVIPSSRTFDDLTGTSLNDWTILEYLGNYYWKCQCSCGKVRAVYCARLKNGTSKSCGHNTNTFKDLTGQTFGDWTVLKYVSDKLWLCKCSCNTEKLVSKDSLLSGKSTSCGHNTTGFKDLTNQTFGKWKVKKYIGNDYWECECECHRIKNIHRQSLLSNESTSCGHCNRLDWQVEARQSQEKFKSVLFNACLSLNAKLTLQDIMYIFNINYSYASSLVRKYNADEYVQYLTDGVNSQAEQELADYIKGLGVNIIQNDRYVLNNKELDIYIPDKNLAIEYNGVYWHSTLKKNRNYHLDKTQACNYKNIHLIHIFEHEWLNDRQQQILKELIKQNLNIKQTVVYARKTTIKHIDKYITKDFLNTYHLQGNSSYEIAYGLYYNNELIQVMTFGKPRFTDKFDYELIRLCSKTGYKIIGGASKLFNFFKLNYPNKSVISYCDLSKFTGKVYEQIGMTFDGLTAPNYIYVNINDLSTLSRMQCTKQNLIKQGYGNINQTEEEMMFNRNYLKIYNCGNARYVYKPNIN